MTLLLDIGHASCSCTDHALDELHKAIADPPGSDAVWRPHHDPYVRDHIEAATRRMVERLAAIADALRGPQAALKPLHKAITGPWASIDEETKEAIERELASLSPESYSVDDWLRLVDLVLQRYLPEEVIASEADYLAVRGVFAGRVKAHMEALHASAEVASLAVGIAPETYADALNSGVLSPRAKAVLDFARIRAAELIVDLTENTRRQIKRGIIEHEERKRLGERVSAWDLQQSLQDKFGELNRDWRRIALTEIGRDANEGFLAAVDEGAKVRRLEAYHDACPFCKRIHGMIFDVVDPAKPDKDGWKEVWLGKTNVGRSASPRKRVGDELIERLPSELWWPAAGVQHPHCRGSWEQVTAAHLDADPEFAAWLRARLEETRPRS